MSEKKYSTELGLHGEPTIVVKGERYDNRKVVAVFENSERGFELATDACDRLNDTATIERRLRA